MEDEKQKIKSMQKKKKHRRREAAAGVGLVALGVLIAFGATQTSILKDVEGNLPGDKQVEHDKEVTIAAGIRPYRTQIQSNQTIRFTNKRSNPINITFETNDIEESLYIENNSSGYFDASKYDNLPYRNYFNVNNGDTGEIIVER